MKISNHIKFISTLGLAFSGLASAVPQALVDGLGDESYQLREKAEQDLVTWAKGKGEGCLDELSDLKKKVESPEVKSRLDNVMSEVNVYKAVPGTRGFMGISMKPMIGSSLINVVSPGSPAEKAGLKVNDKIIELDGVDLSKKNAHANEAMDFLREYVKSKKEGEKLTVKIDRQGKILTKNVKLGNYDEYLKGLDLWRMRNGAMPQVIPMNGGRVKPMQLNLSPKQRKENELGRLERSLKIQEQMLGREEFPQKLKGILEKENDLNKKRIEALRKELKLEEKKEDKKK